MAEQNDSQAVISDILEDVQDEQTSEVEDSQEEETSQEEPTQGEPTITEEQAKAWGLHHSFVGKPIAELGEAYRNLVADYTRKSQRLKELEKQKPSEETQEILDDMPDPVEDLDGFKEWVKKQISNPRRDPEIEAYIQREKEQKILQAIQTQLPDNVDVEGVIREWGQAGYVQNERDLEYWLNHPETFVNSVAMFYTANELRKKQMKEAKLRGDNDVKKTERAIRTKQTSVTELNSEGRARGDKSGVVGELLDDLTFEQQI